MPCRCWARRSLDHRLALELLGSRRELASTPLVHKGRLVLDAITLLEFQEVDDWRGYCNTNRLANPEPFDPRSVQLLNDCYAKGITNRCLNYRRRKSPCRFQMRSEKHQRRAAK